MASQVSTTSAKAVVWGVDGITYSGITFDSTDTDPYLNQQAEVRRTASRKEIPDDIGDVVCHVFYKQQKTVSIDVIPTGTTLAKALNNLNDLCAAPGTIITIADTDADTDESLFDGANSGKFILIESSVTRSNESEARIRMELVQDVDNDTAVAVS